MVGLSSTQPGSGSVETLTESFDQEADKDCPKTGFISVRSKEKLDYEDRGCCCSRWTKTKICGVTFLGCVVVTLIGMVTLCVVCGVEITISYFSVIGCVVGSFLLQPTLEGNAEEWEGKLFQERNLNRNISLVSTMLDSQVVFNISFSTG